ncbi:MAG: hypothetical protein WBH47_22065 [Streptosporangiaceae bacterium]
MEVSATDAASPAAPETAAEPAARGWRADAAPGSGRRFPAAVGIGSFLVFTTVLLVRNAYLFSTRIYENQDFAANTIAVLQAKHFQLLTGNYSKEGFFHPGPAFLYVMAAGEALFHDALHLVPTPWNGQLIAVLLLNSALIGATLAVIARQAGSARVVLTCLVLTLAFVAVHPLTVNSAWFPYLYFAPVLLMLVSAASVATGQTFALPPLALSAWLCVHGQAEFLLFAPATVVVALAGLFAAHRDDVRGMIRGTRRHWIGAAVVSALFALPIFLYTVTNWPGEFGAYLRYRATAANDHLIHHSLATSAGFVLRFWWPGTPTGTADRGGRYVLLGLVVVALLLALRCPVPSLRRFLLWLLAMAGVMTVLFLGYAQTSVENTDISQQSYLGYFYWAAPLVVTLVVGAGAVVHLRSGRSVALALTAAVTAAAVIAAIVPQRQDNPDDPPAKYYGVPQLPQLVRTLARAADGRPVEVIVADNAWFDAVGVVAYADRTGVRSCVGGPGERRYRFLFRPQSICTASESRAGFQVWFSPPGMKVAPDQVVVARLREAWVTRLSSTAR